MGKLIGFRRKPRGWGRKRAHVSPKRPARSIAKSYGFIAFAALLLGAMLLHLVSPRPMLGLSGHSTQRVTAAAVDGDTLRTSNARIRLLGIDAPELHQMCLDEHGRPWACGQKAHAHLSSLVARGLVTCTSHSLDRYGRLLATCSVADIADISDAMVRAGMAIAYRSVWYWPAEFEARWNKRGLWRGRFQRPADWRHDGRQP